MLRLAVDKGEADIHIGVKRCILIDRHILSWLDKNVSSRRKMHSCTSCASQFNTSIMAQWSSSNPYPDLPQLATHRQNTLAVMHPLRLWQLRSALLNLCWQALKPISVHKQWKWRLCLCTPAQSGRPKLCCTAWFSMELIYSVTLKRCTNSTTKVYHNVVVRMGWQNRHLLKSALIRGLAPRVKHFQGKLEANYLHSISNAHLNKLPIEYEWWSHLDNDKHILGLIKGCAGRSEVLKVPHYRAKEHMYQSLLSAAGRCQLWDQPAVLWKSWLKFHKSRFFKGSFKQTKDNRDRLLYMFISSTWIGIFSMIAYGRRSAIWGARVRIGTPQYTLRTRPTLCVSCGRNVCCVSIHSPQVQHAVLWCTIARIVCKCNGDFVL